MSQEYRVEEEIEDDYFEFNPVTCCWGCRYSMKECNCDNDPFPNWEN